jgi:hypothetical protein
LSWSGHLHHYEVAGTAGIVGLAEEPDQAVDVLGGGCQEELLLYEFQPAEPEPIEQMWL